MSSLSLTEQLLAAKAAKKLNFEQVAVAIGRSEVWTAALFYGQAAASEEEAAKLLSLLELPHELAHQLTQYPVKGELVPAVPTDPLIYRFHEITLVYGLPLKAIIQEKFGDGIMSAIDFTMDVEKVEDPKGDRVKVTMNGKFLAYKKW